MSIIFIVVAMALTGEAILTVGCFTSLWQRIKKALRCYTQDQRDEEIDAYCANELRVENIMTCCGGRTLSFRSSEAMRSREFTQYEQEVSEHFTPSDPRE